MSECLVIAWTYIENDKIKFIEQQVICLLFLKKNLFIRSKKIDSANEIPHYLKKYKKKKQLVIDEFVIHKGKAKR